MVSRNEPTPAYSPETDTHYPSWEALVEAEANGYVVVAIITSGKETWPYIVGPIPDKDEANKARNRLRAKWKREMRQYPLGQKVTFHVRPSWKMDR